MRYLSILALFLISCAHQSQPNLELYDQIVVVGTNDFHGYLRTTESRVQDNIVLAGGAEWFAGYVKILEKKFGENLVLLDAGDIFQGTIESNSFYGASTMAYYNLLPYRAAAIGNHEFDYGGGNASNDPLGVIKARMKEAKFPFVQANIFYKKNGAIWRESNLYPHAIVQVGKYKIGIIGLTTESTPNKTRPQNVAALDFRSIIDSAKKEISDVRAKGVDFIFITTHEGGPHDGEPIHELLKALPKGSVDAIVTGHSHTEVHEFVQGVPAIQSKTRGLFFGRIDLFVNKKTKKIEEKLTKIHDMHPICGTWFKNSENCDAKKAMDALSEKKENSQNIFPLRPAYYEGSKVERDPRVAQVLSPYFSKVEKIKKEVLGHAKSDFEKYPMSGSSDVGTLFLDAFHWKFPRSKVIYLNGGGFRRLLSKGAITYGDIYEVHPFDNYAVEVKINGKKLKDLIRLGLSGAQMIPEIWGVRAVYNSKNAKPRDINGDGKMDKWESDTLTSLVWANNNKPVRDEEEFWLATNDYLQSGGDNTDHIFKDAKNIRASDFTQRDLAAEYLRKHPGLNLPGKPSHLIQQSE